VVFLVVKNNVNVMNSAFGLRGRKQRKEAWK
jgi:hypothetical protein